MSFIIKPPRKEVQEVFEKSYEKKTMELNKALELPENKFWWVKFILLFTIQTVLTLPLLIISFIQNVTKKKKDVRGKVILVSGAARGLGRQLSLQLSRLGAWVACVDINGIGAAETAQMIRKEGGKAAAFTTNVAKLDQIEKLRTDVEKELGPVDILVNNAALLMAAQFTEWEENKIRGLYDVNILSHLWMMKTFVPSMIKRKGGQVVTMSSGAGLFGTPFLSLYGSSKAAVTSLADNLREEMNALGHPIKFTTIHPIFINTSLEVAEFCDVGYPVMKEEESAAEMVDAILLEKENMSIPSAVWLVSAFDRLMPNIFHKLSLQIIRPTVSLPERQFRDTMPLNRIIDETMKNKTL